MWQRVGGGYLKAAVQQARNVWVRLTEVKIGGDGPVVYRYQNFGEGREAGRRLGVSHVRLGRTDEQRTGTAVAAEHLRDAVRLLQADTRDKISIRNV